MSSVLPFIPFPQFYAMSSFASQVVTRRPQHTLRTYPSISLASAAIARLLYRGDTVQSLADDVAGAVGLPSPPVPEALGKLKIDFLRHPSAVQAGIDAIDSGSVSQAVFGDCEDGSGWLAAQWVKGRLVDDGSVRLVYVSWSGDRAHMCVEAKKGGEFLCASNFYRFQPRAMTVEDMMREATRSNLDDVVRWAVSLDDLEFIRLSPI